MITIKGINNNGVISPEIELPKTNPFGMLFNGMDYLIFESQKEADENIPEIEVKFTDSSDNTVLSLFKTMSPEGLEQLKQILNIEK